MNANQLLKSLLIAVPMLTLAACSSSQSADDAANQQTNQQQQGQDSGSGVELDAAERTKTPEEIRAEKWKHYSAKTSFILRLMIHA